MMTRAARPRVDAGPEYWRRRWGRSSGSWSVMGLVMRIPPGAVGRGKGGRKGERETGERPFGAGLRATRGVGLGKLRYGEASVQMRRLSRSRPDGASRKSISNVPCCPGASLEGSEKVKSVRITVPAESTNAPMILTYV